MQFPGEQNPKRLDPEDRNDCKVDHHRQRDHCGAHRGQPCCCSLFHSPCINAGPASPCRACSSGWHGHPPQAMQCLPAPCPLQDTRTPDPEAGQIEEVILIVISWLLPFHRPLLLIRCVLFGKGVQGKGVGGKPGNFDTANRGEQGGHRPMGWTSSAYGPRAQGSQGSMDLRSHSSHQSLSGLAASA